MECYGESRYGESRAQVGTNGKVLMGLSGGVDSSVAVALIHRAIGSRLESVFVDTGLLRAGERERMEHVFARQLGLELRVVDASDLFLDRLAGVLDPEQNRRIIAHTFIERFEKEARPLAHPKFLPQAPPSPPRPHTA